MAKVDLPGGHSATIQLTMLEFRALWSSGAVKKLQGLGDGGDLAEAYPLLAKAVAEWDVTDAAGNALDPGAVASYDQLEPSTFMKLMGAVARYIGGEDSKN